MSCNSYNSNTPLPLTMVAATLPAGFVHTDWQTTFEEFVSNIAATLPGNYSTFIVSDTTPSANDQDKLWLQVASDCRPVGLFLYFGGAWVQVGSNLFYGVDTSSTVNVYTVATTSPVVNQLAVGQKFLIKTATTNTGPAVITINTPMAISKAIKKNGTQALTGFETIAGGIMELVWDGVNMQILNPRTDVTIPHFDIENNSFETDDDADAVPDKWVQTLTGTATGVRYATDAIHGCYSYKVVVPVGTGNGYAKITNLNFINVDGGIYVHVSWWIKSTHATIPLFVLIDWYDCNAAYLSTSTIYTEAANNPVSVWYKMAGVALAPAAAANFKITLQTGDNVSVLPAATVLWDDVRVERPVYLNLTKGDQGGTADWVCPTGVYQARVTCIGSGGGGGGGNGVSSAGSGGGGGGSAQSYIVTVPGTTYAIVIGVAGTAGAGAGNGGNGNNSTFAATVVIGNGGTKGNANSGGTAGTGGGGTGTIVLSGSGATVSSGATPGVGGHATGGGMGGKTVAGSTPGGGGAGGLSTGFAGGSGTVIIEY